MCGLFCVVTCASEYPMTRCLDDHPCADSTCKGIIHNTDSKRMIFSKKRLLDSLYKAKVYNARGHSKTHLSTTFIPERVRHAFIFVDYYVSIKRVILHFLRTLLFFFLHQIPSSRLIVKSHIPLIVKGFASLYLHLNCL